MHEQTAQTPISLNIDIVWSESLLSAWTNAQADLSLLGLQAILFVWIFKNLLRFMSRDRRDVTALATQVNKCTEVKWAVNFNINGNGKMMKNGLYLFKFSDFFTSLRLFWRENIVICPAMIILIIKALSPGPVPDL